VGRRVCGELLSKDRLWVVTWRTTGRDRVAEPGVTRGMACLGVVTLTEILDTGLGLTIPSSMVLTVLLTM
jgi:hypothetical protein